MVIASVLPETHSGLTSGLAGSATQVGAALGTATGTGPPAETANHGTATGAP